ncbi:flagellar operon protein [Anoxybacillus sp. LAT_35]|nr:MULTISPECIES: TIGR02530 family flagellar biosynthesis protein [unclassified Anoxybacillus]MCG6170709.1 flagellar operon protein [Anoxybacillus sp. LAT_11]MCG6178225.1 flagellar operon protein [Anoxybacillus sp. LAT_35]MCG6182374.1 flagellar operon protein [Anoxybacillus sp. LAT_26]MCG6196627.1 flagellar operon protein [Anoxybacillus sp. LAT_38]
MNRIQFFPHTPLIPPKKQAAVQTEQQSFRDALVKAEQTLKISKHAQQRLQERNIHINDEQWALIGQKVVEAKQKGVRDSLVITNEAALIVSAVNQTVITAMDRNEAQSQLFTNINGAIII